MEEALELLNGKSPEILLNSLEFSEIDLFRFSEGIKRNGKSLKVLKLFFCTTTMVEEGMISLIRGISYCTEIEHVCFYGTGLSDSQAQELIFSLKHKHNLNTINLHSNNITDTCCLIIVENLKEWPKLTRLCLSNNEISEHGILALQNAIKMYPNIIECQYSANNNNNNAVVVVQPFDDDNNNEQQQLIGMDDDLLLEQSQRIIELEQENNRKDKEIIRLMKELQEKNREIEKLNKSYQLEAADDETRSHLMMMKKKSEDEPILRKPKLVVQRKQEPDDEIFIPLNILRKEKERYSLGQSQNDEEMRYKMLQKIKRDEELYIPRKSTIEDSKSSTRNKETSSLRYKSSSNVSTRIKERSPISSFSKGTQHEKQESIKGILYQDDSSFVIKRRQEERNLSFAKYTSSDTSIFKHSPRSYAVNEDNNEDESTMRMKFDELSMGRKHNKERIEMERRLLGEDDEGLILRKTLPPIDRKQYHRKEEIIPKTKTKTTNWICPICEYENSSIHTKCVRFRHHSIIHWTCHVCTFVNENQQLRCEMCAQRKL